MISEVSCFHQINSKIRNLRRSEFIRNAMLLFSGTLIAQIISVVSAPVITRLFTPQNLGVFALFSAIVTIVSGESSLCYERAIVLPEKNEDAINVFSLSLVIHLGISAGILFILLIFGRTLESLFKSEIDNTWIWLIPLAVLLGGTGKILRFWRIRNKHFKAISSASIIEASAGAGIKIAFGFFIGALAGGLIAGLIIGFAAVAFLLYFKPDRIKFGEYKSHTSWERQKEVGRQYKSFPLFASWNNLMTQLSNYIIIFMFSYFFNAAIVGFYSLCNRFLGNPVSMISQSVQNAYFQKAGESLSKGVNLHRNFKRITFGLILTGFPPFLILTIWGEFIFVVIFGQNWATAGSYVQIMAPWYFITYLMSPANVIFEVCQKQNIRLGFNLSLTILRFVSLLVGYRLSKDPQFSILLFVLVSSFIQLLIIITAFFITRDKNAIMGNST